MKLVGPYAPHLGDEAWEQLGEKGFLLEATWPTLRRRADPSTRRSTLGVQVDGKLRGRSRSRATPSEDDARAAALALPNVAKHLEGRKISKFIYKPGRIIGIVSAPA